MKSMPAPELSTAEAVELLSIGVRRGVNDKARAAFRRSIAEVDFTRFRGWRS